MKKLIVATLITFTFLTSRAQNLRTFNNIELGTSLSKSTHQYSLFWGESLQLSSPVPVRFTTGLRYSLNSINKGLSKGIGQSTISSLAFDKKAWYHTFAIPVGLEFFHKGFAIGAFQEVVSLSGKKKFNETFGGDSTATVPLLKTGEYIRTQGLSSVFSTKQNLTGGLYLVYTFNDSFSIKAGYNMITSTFTKSNDTRDLSYIKLRENTFNLGIRLNIEK
jgi:hypothetical protein